MRLKKNISIRPNDLFFIEQIKNLIKDKNSKKNIKVLDYGCGIGQLVQLGLNSSLNIYGVDTYENYYEEWQKKIPKNILSRISKIHNNKTKFKPNTFDFVVSNQVFEHIEKPQFSFEEIARILKPRGIFLNIFPNKSVFYEGHIGLYFPHWLKKNSLLQSMYLYICYFLFLGRKRHLKVDGWKHILNDITFYHTIKSIDTMVFNSFFFKAEDLTKEYVNFRIQKSRFKRQLRKINNYLNFFLVFLTKKRAGSILKIINNK